MFSNFVTFKEVVKLSGRTFNNLKEVNYSDKLLPLIQRKADIDAFQQVSDLIRNKKLVTNFISLLLATGSDKEKRWIENILKFINFIDPYVLDNRLVMACCKFDFNTFTKLLLENGFDVNSKNGFILRRETDKGNLEVIDYLIDIGAKVNDKNSNALAIATMNGNYELVKKLVKHGAAKRGSLALEYAAHKGYMEIIEYLIENGHNPRARNNSTLSAAITAGHLNVVKFLMDKGCRSADALRDAIMASSIEIVKYLVENGEFENQQNNDELLLISLSVKRTEILKYLIENGANVNEKVLKYAESNSSPEIIEYLKESLKRQEIYN